MGTVAMAEDRAAERTCGGAGTRPSAETSKSTSGVGGHKGTLAVDARGTNAPSLALVAVGLRGVEVVAADLDSRV